LQSILENFVGRWAAQPRDEAGSTGVVVRVPPVRLAPLGYPHGAATHNKVIVAASRNVQCRIFLECINFLGAIGEGNSLKLGHFAKMKIAHFHWRDDHFKCLFTRRAARRPQAFNIP
jgi:hypothetical protein